ncbi:MAG: 3-hydroxyacyl-CoA dehydrogenase [Roseibium sp.]|nr:3-hydroxyacyl-CoA dehydrogenase [Roseibium sp.]
MQDKTPTPRKITILGAGSIGLSFAAVFADSGAHVRLVDPDIARRAAADLEIAVHQAAIGAAGLTRGGAGVINVLDQAGTSIADADLILECGPEDVTAKQAIFADILSHVSREAVVATASSAITISQIVPEPERQRRCLVAHPVNPPSVLRIIELVPAPGTDPDATKTASDVFRAVGFEAVQLGHEIEGFVLNRLQSAVLREAYRLVDEGVTDAAGIDTVMRMGLGPRWALSGPFETAELNTPGGIKAHAARMGPAYKRIGEDRGETVDWNSDLVAKVDAQRRSVLPAGALPKRVAWRSSAVARLVAERDKLMQD